VIVQREELIVSFTTPILVPRMHSAAFVVISIIIMGGILARSISIAYTAWHRRDVRSTCIA
jgi:hypothetical protein